MTDEQVWTDLERFAAAMKRGATVVFGNGDKRPFATFTGRGIGADLMRDFGGIREIIEPPQKKIRPLNAEEWRDVAGCIFINPPEISGTAHVFAVYHPPRAAQLADMKATCHPPGNSKDVRRLWVEK